MKKKLGRITILGFGPSLSERMTLEARDHLSRAEKIFLRTVDHPAVEFLKSSEIKFESCDRLYEEADKYTDLYGEIASTIVSAAKSWDVTYCVPGNPFFAEESTSRVIESARSEGIEVVFIPGMSFLDEVVCALEVDPISLEIRLLDAHDMEGLRLSADQNLIIVQLSGRLVASDVKLNLLHHFAPDHRVKLVDGTSGIVEEKKLVDIDILDEYSALTSLFVPALSPERATSFDDLVAKISVLRSPSGCPWDREQTHSSLRHHLLEETYETLEALDEMDVDKLKGELGDLLLQIILHSQIAHEEGDFSIADVLKTINEKIVRRHPHVFGEKKAEDAKAVRAIWEDVKKGEEGRKLFEGVPKELPALLYAQKIQNRAADMDFDWEDVSGVIEKICEEGDELIETVEVGGDIEDELGDLFFSLVNLSRSLEIDAESAMRRAADKFRARLSLAHELAEKDGRAFEAISLEEKEKYWVKAKNELHNP